MFSGAGQQASKEHMRKYVRQVLVTTPGGTKSFDRLIVAANEAFNQLESGDLLVDKQPTYLPDDYAKPRNRGRIESIFDR